MKFWTLMLAAFLVFSTGCGTLFPKRVEFFQDKVKTFPEQKASEKEVQRQAALMAKERAAETLRAAEREQTSTSVTKPAQDTAALTDAVSESLGPPRHPASGEATNVAAELRVAISKLNARLDDFKKANDENAGKKIENTGWLQVPYFMWIGIVGVVAFVGLIIVGVAWSALKFYALSNPPVQLGVGAVQLGANFLKKAVGEVVAGGERFKAGLQTKIADPKLQAEVLDLFRIEHERAQSSDVQTLVKDLTQK